MLYLISFATIWLALMLGLRWVERWTNRHAEMCRRTTTYRGHDGRKQRADIIAPAR